MQFSSQAFKMKALEMCLLYYYHYCIFKLSCFNKDWSTKGINKDWSTKGIFIVIMELYFLIFYFLYFATLLTYNEAFCTKDLIGYLDALLK